MTREELHVRMSTIHLAEPEQLQDLARRLADDLEQAWQERDEALTLAYIGEHHFPDQAWKSRCAELIEDLAEAGARQADMGRTANQYQINQGFLLSRMDAAHDVLCQDHIGSWQQKAEHVVVAAKELTATCDEALKVINLLYKEA